MSRFYILISIVILLYILHFILVYRRYKKEGDDFVLNDGNQSWKRLENFTPYLILAFGINAMMSPEIEAWMVNIGLSDVLIFLIQCLAAALFTIFALLGFKIYLKVAG